MRPAKYSGRSIWFWRIKPCLRGGGTGGLLLALAALPPLDEVAAMGKGLPVEAAVVMAGDGMETSFQRSSARICLRILTRGTTTSSTQIVQQVSDSKADSIVCNLLNTKGVKDKLKFYQLNYSRPVSDCNHEIRRRLLSRSNLPEQDVQHSNPEGDTDPQDHLSIMP